MITQVVNDIRKPDVDERTYKSFVLGSNQLCVVLCSDPNTDKSSAAINVQVGQFSDPKEAPGLAHFLEHLLFMGTSKYPVENEYSRFLNEHGGWSNAYTSMENTNYFFEVANHGFEGAIDRFAQFFIAPLFNESGVEREMNAVDSEHKKNIQSDLWRIWQTEKDLTNPSFPYSKFGTGNLETLGSDLQAQGLKIRTFLIEFYERHYSANLMTLCLLGKESIEELEQYAIKYFSDIPNKGYPVPTFKDSTPFENCHLLGQALRIIPVKDTNSIELVFPFPPVRPLYKSKPNRVLSHLIGHEAEGSILALLKKRGLALGLSAGAAFGGNDFEFFRINVDCTPRGITQIPDILDVIFDYISIMSKNGIPKLYFQEVQTLSLIEFKTREENSPAGLASFLSRESPHYPAEEILCGNTLLEVYDPEALSSCLALLRPDNFLLKVVSKTLTPVSTSGWKTTKHYGTEWELIPLSYSYSPMKSSDSLHLPLINPFIPSNFDLIPKDGDRSMDNDSADPIEAFDKVTEIWNSSLLRMWYSDNSFSVPKAHVYLNIHCMALYDSPLLALEAAFFVMLFKEKMIPLLYNASVAGLDFHVTVNRTYFTLSFSGYNDKMAMLVVQVAQAFCDFLKNPHIADTVYVNLKDKIKRKLENWYKDAPSSHASYWSGFSVENDTWSVAEKLAIFSELPASVSGLSHSLWTKSSWVEGFVIGNIQSMAGRKLGSDLEKVLLSLQSSPFPEERKLPQERAILLEPQPTIIQIRGADSENVNSAIDYYIQFRGVSAEDLTLRAQVGLLRHLISEPCFDILRTQETLGYLVSSSLKNLPGVLGFKVRIQSGRHPMYLESRIEAFLRRFGDEILAPMTTEEWNRHVKAYSAKLLEKDKSLEQMANRLYYSISDGSFAFNRSREIAGLLDQLSHSSLVAFYQEHVLPSTKQSKLSVHIISQKIEAAENGEGATGVDDSSPSLLSFATAAHVFEVMERVNDVADPVVGMIRQWRGKRTVGGPVQRVAGTTVPMTTN